MSDYQFIRYADVRKKEIEKDSKKKKPSAKKDLENSELFKDKSSYRAYSRTALLFCISR